MSSDNIPVLKPEIVMAAPGEPQPKADETSAKLYQDAQSSVVKITSDGKKTASGFVIGDGSQVVTTAHNLNGSSQQFAHKDGKRYKLEIEKMDDITDVAILKVKGGVIPGAKALEIGKTESLEADDKVWALSFPKAADTKNAYLSPGYARGIEPPIELLSNINPDILPILKDKIEHMNEEQGKDAALFLAQPMLATKVHIEAGGAGAPLLNQEGKVVGMTALTNGLHPQSGETLGVVAENISALMDGKSKFEFQYSAHSAAWAENYVSDWRDHAGLAALDTGLVGAAGWLAYKGALRFPTGASAGIGAYGLMKLTSDANHLMQSTDGLDGAKYGLAALADLGTIGGAAMTLAPKMRGYGLALTGASLLGRAATDFIKNNWVLDETKRLDDKTNRPAFNFDALLRP